MLNNVNYELICKKLREYIENHNELENFRLIVLLDKLLGGVFNVDKR